MKKRNCFENEEEQIITREEGKNNVKKLIQEENDAIRAFFSNDKPKKKKLKKKQSTETKLAVPLSESVPAVVEMEQSGGGLVYNAFTGKTKKVSRGIHATKGRGIITDKMIPTKTLSKSTLDSITSNNNYSETKNTSEIKNSETKNTRNHQEKSEDQIQEDVPLLTQDTLIPDHFYGVSEKNEMVYKPIYTDDAWSGSVVRDVKKQMASKKLNNNNIPSFYIRREEKPHEVVLNETLKPQSKEDEDEPSQYNISTENRCKFLTFNSDGTFKWPKSSPFLCWVCCHNFSCPPAIIPRHYNKVYKYFEMYGNFCSWSCAKRFASTTTQEYYSDTSTSVDYFAWKYFGASLPIPVLPPQYLLENFSEFGMSIEEYRNIGKVYLKDNTICENYAIVHPPCVPYELLVLWQKKRPQKINQIKKGYHKDKKRLFEDRMKGDKPLPDMPAAISLTSNTISDIQPGKFIKSSSKRKKKDLLSIL